MRIPKSEQMIWGKERVLLRHTIVNRERISQIKGSREHALEKIAKRWGVGDRRGGGGARIPEVCWLEGSDNQMLIFAQKQIRYRSMRKTERRERKAGEKERAGMPGENRESIRVRGLAMLEEQTEQLSWEIGYSW